MTGGQISTFLAIKFNIIGVGYFLLILRVPTHIARVLLCAALDGRLLSPPDDTSIVNSNVIMASFSFVKKQ